MKKVSALLLTAAVTFSVGIISAVLWLYSPIPEPVKSPPEMHFSKQFPGNSFPVTQLDSPESSDKSDSYFSAFQEERFESRKFQDAKNYPEIAMADEIYRLHWLRTFHNPVLIRVYRIGEEKFITAKQTDGRGGYDFGKLSFNKTRQLNDSEWFEFMDLLDRADFWNKQDSKMPANDGAFWTIEGVREQRYYKAAEQSPQEGEFRDACIYLMRISGLNINESSPEFY